MCVSVDRARLSGAHVVWPGECVQVITRWKYQSSAICIKDALKQVLNYRDAERAVNYWSARCLCANATNIPRAYVKYVCTAAETNVRAHTFLHSTWANE
jgi:hypothetical protein